MTTFKKASETSPVTRLFDTSFASSQTETNSTLSKDNTVLTLKFSNNSSNTDNKKNATKSKITSYLSTDSQSFPMSMVISNGTEEIAVYNSSANVTGTVSSVANTRKKTVYEQMIRRVIEMVGDIVRFIAKLMYKMWEYVSIGIGHISDFLSKLVIIYADITLINCNSAISVSIETRKAIK